MQRTCVSSLAYTHTYTHTITRQSHRDIGTNIHGHIYRQTNSKWKNKQNISNVNQIVLSLVDGGGYFWRKYHQIKLLSSNSQKSAFLCLPSTGTKVTLPWHSRPYFFKKISVKRKDITMAFAINIVSVTYNRTHTLKRMQRG